MATEQPRATTPAGHANCANTSVGLTPLPDLRTGAYHGYEGGLYPGGANQPPPAYVQEGLAHAGQVLPRDRAGAVAPDGSAVLLSIGMSNATQEFAAFMRLADADRRKQPKLVIVDGAQGGQDAIAVSNPHGKYWPEVERRLQAAGVAAPQVQAVWLKEAIAGPREAFPADAQRLQQALRTITGILTGRYPNLQLIYLSCRTYAGYATTPLNPEPYAYQSGFAVRWLIQERIAGTLTGPWLGWGPYLWTDGEKGRSDGLVWTCADVGPDGTHPSPQGGVPKVATLLLNFFTSDPTAKPWFGR